MASTSNKPPSPASSSADAAKHRGANRSSKTAGKLKVLPEQPEPDGPALIVPKAQGPPSAGTAVDSDEADVDDDEDPEDEENQVYNQINLIPDGTARRDALKLTRKRAKALPRVTAYTTANSYRLQDLMKFFNARKESYHTDARMIDEVIYTPYYYQPASHTSDGSASRQFQHVHFATPTADLLGVPELAEEDGELLPGQEAAPTKKRSKFDPASPEADIFIFGYGTVVIWGMTEAQEKRFLSSLKRFEVEKLGPDDVEMEDLNFYYANYSRIYNDVITLRKGSSFMTKLSLSHALSQSVKISLFEELIANTIEETKDIPEAISETGKIGLTHKEIMQKIGQLFLLRTSINSVGSVLDSPEVFWTFPDLQPLYDAARSYLEIPQRINLLNSRVDVLQDMLQLLKESVSSRHSERLEIIVIILIAIEILLGVITIAVDLFAG